MARPGRPKKTTTAVKEVMDKVEAEKAAETKTVAKKTTKAAEEKATETKTVAKTTAKKTTKAAEEKAAETKTAVKTTTRKTTAAKKAEPTVYVQCCGYEVTTAAITAKVADAVGKKSVKELNIYVKPEEGTIYYTADGEQGSVAL